MENKNASVDPKSRSRYESPEQNYSEWMQALQRERQWLRRFLGFIEGRLLLRQSLLVVIFCALISIVIFWPIKKDFSYRIGDIPTQDIHSPFSFDMEDAVTTEDKRLKAESSVLSIYDYDPQLAEKIALDVYRAFKNARSYLREKRKSSQEIAILKSGFEADLGQKIPDPLFLWLSDNKFHPRIENAIIRTLDLWHDQKITESSERQLANAQSQILARTISRRGVGKEFLFNRSEMVDLQDPLVFSDVDKKSQTSLSEAEKLQVLRLSRSLLQPNLTLNKQATTEKKREAREAILPVTISIKKNQVIGLRGQAIQVSQRAIFQQIEERQSDRRKVLMILGSTAVLSLMIFIFHGFLRRFSVSIVKLKTKDSLVLLLIAFGSVLFTQFFLFLCDLAFVSRYGDFLTHKVFLAAAPVATGAMLVSLLMVSGELVWFFIIFNSICMGVLEDFNFQFMAMTLMGGFTAARGVFGCRTRNDIYGAGLRTGLVNAVIFGFFLFVSKLSQDESLGEVWWVIPAGFLGGIFSSFLTLIMIPFLENAFNYTTDVKLLELANLNHPLMRDMIVKAPGTYHHSMMVGNMVEAAAEEIGANPLLSRVMAYYHDIGKVAHAEYFIENQKPGFNPHDDISPYLSKTLLISHVKDGAELGIKYKLGEPIIDGILQHHGTTVISYFYNKAVEMDPSIEGDTTESEFRYPGPKPQFKESALCMLADSIEAAARALDEPTPQRLQHLVTTVIQRKFSDGQLDQCNLSLKDLTKIENTFVRILLGVYHQRIAYPQKHQSPYGGISEFRGDLRLGGRSGESSRDQTEGHVKELRPPGRNK